MSEWKDGNTAPHNGRHILATWGGKVEVVFFGIFHQNARGKPCWRDAVHGHKRLPPKHWCDIPPGVPADDYYLELMRGGE